MASKTTNYNLDMPAYNEIADIDVINGNMDKIDVQMKKNADSAQQSKDIVSDEYSATNTYAVGDYCIRENVLYKCKTAITTGEAFDSSKWVQTTCGTEVAELNSNLDTLSYDEIAGGKNLIDLSKTKDGYFIRQETGELQDTSVGVLATDFIEVVSGKKYYYSGMDTLNRGNTGAMYDNNKNYVGVIINDVDIRPLTIPTNVKYIRLNIWKTCYTDVKKAQLEEGTQDTPYEPYIPSVKMLADEVSNIKNDLGGLSFSVSGTTLSITDGTNTWTLPN